MDDTTASRHETGAMVDGGCAKETSSPLTLASLEVAAMAGIIFEVLTSVITCSASQCCLMVLGCC